MKILLTTNKTYRNSPDVGFWYTYTPLVEMGHEVYWFDSVNPKDKNYSKIIPSIGKLIVGDREPYEYLVKSINNFVNQDELLNLLEECNFKKANFININGGIVAIHYGWKI